MRISITTFLFLLAVGGCEPGGPRPDLVSQRDGDEIVICSRRFHTGTPVVLWSDPDGYNAYAPRCFFDRSRVLPSSPAAGCDTPQRFNFRECLNREIPGSLAEFSNAYDIIRQSVDQMVIHYDAAGASRRCFEVLHDERGLSAHFLIDMDGTVYQTLDVRERARHAGCANDRSIGVEIANIGAYDTREELRSAHRRLSDRAGQDHIAGAPPLSQRSIITGYLQGRRLHQISFTDAQYESLIKLTRTLCNALPRLQPTFPGAGSTRSPTAPDTVLTSEQLAQFSGVLGHYHISPIKIDPGPAFDWERLAEGLQQAP
ncbi:MAG: N-acetylmuramoyl-L-alanine amidase, partial [Planctomycetes bacterium]|nr:N-acetylmuramoyl-L-alanine amidase [Planctomycetota bacterium]